MDHCEDGLLKQLMDSNRFLNVLGELPTMPISDNVEALTDPWNIGIVRMMDS